MGQSAAERMKCYRARRDAGLSTFHLVLNETDVAEMLVRGGLLSAFDADDHRKICLALKRQIGILCELARDA